MSLSKRLFDLLGGTVLIILALPFLLVITVLVLCVGGHPVFFCQERIGRNGKPFRMLKFRTMRQGAAGSALTVGNDPRVTSLGRWLRRSKLDELPQLFHVLAGTMSLVGPRPEVPCYVARYTAEQRQVLLLTPGITDPASIRYRRESELLATMPDPERYYLEVVMNEKIAINLAYAARATVWSDLRVILATLFCGFGYLRSTRIPVFSSRKMRVRR